MRLNTKHILPAAAALAIITGTMSCSDSTSYAELLEDENQAVNLFLSDQRVVGYVPSDSGFEVGKGAPFYQMDQDANIYMQVLDPGDMNVRPTTMDRVYFRYVRYALSYYESGSSLSGTGNSYDLPGENGIGTTYFLFDNYDYQASYQYGSGIQVPMYFLGAGAKVNLVVKSQYGWSDEISYVMPFLYTIRYYSSPLSPWQCELSDYLDDDAEQE